MKGTLVTKSQSLSTQADYTGEGLKIDVNYNEDAITSTLMSLSGTIYKTATGTAEDHTYAGKFNGQLNGDDIEYSMSGVKSKDKATVVAALDDIEQLIAAGETNVPNNAQEGE